MHCPHCGAEQQAENKPCTHCGRHVPEHEAQWRSPTLAFVASDPAPADARRMLQEVIDLEARGDFRSAFIICQSMIIDHFDSLTPRWKFAIYKIMGRVSSLQEKEERARKYLLKANAIFAGDEEVTLLLQDLAPSIATVDDLTTPFPDLSEPTPPPRAKAVTRKTREETTIPAAPVDEVGMDLRETIRVNPPPLPQMPDEPEEPTHRVKLPRAPGTKPAPAEQRKSDRLKDSTLDVALPAGMVMTDLDSDPDRDLDSEPGKQTGWVKEELLGKISTIDVPLPMGRVAAAEQSSEGLWSVGFFKRAVALGFDGLFTGALLVMSMVAYSLSQGQEMFAVLQDAFGELFSILLLGASYAGLLLFYLTVFTWLGGQSIGKMALGLKVVGFDGRTLSLGRTLLRSIGMVLAALPGLSGFLWTAFDANRRGWHDRLGRSLVVRVQPSKKRIEKAESRTEK